MARTTIGTGRPDHGTGGRYAELFTLQAAGYDANPTGHIAPVLRQHGPTGS